MSIELKDELVRVGVQALDDSYERVSNMISVLDDTIADGGHYYEERMILQSIYNAAEQTFTQEEDLMRRRDYPGLPEHAQAHRDYLQRVDRMVISLNSGGSGLNPDQAYFLNTWLNEHRAELDQACASYLQGGGVED